MRLSCIFAYGALALLLGGCAQSVGLPGADLLNAAQPSDESNDPLLATIDEDTGGSPPLPHRNEQRLALAANSNGKAAGSDGSNGQNTPEEGSAFSLAGLPSLNVLTAGTSTAPQNVSSDASAIETYTIIARQINSCWLNRVAPKLTDHGFHADVAPGDTKEARIIIYKKAPDGKRGLQAFKISIVQGITGSIIASENRKLDTKQDNEFRADLARWAAGDPKC